MKLTDKQKAFCDYYIETLNATESYKRAGYKGKGNVAEAAASRLLRNVKVAKYIEEKMQVKESDRVASQNEVLEYLTRVLRGEEKEENVTKLQSKTFEDGVMYVDEKVEIVLTAANIRDRNKAAELLGRRYATWTDRQQIDANIGVQIIDDIGSEEDAD